MVLSRSLVLSGFMATGKSTVGKIVARELGVPFVDTDKLLEAETGISTGELFAKEGEARFRDREAALIPPLLRDVTPRVIAFGGGVATIPRVRHEALERATVVTLTATPETIASRATSLAERPNLGAMSPASRASDLLTLRREVYGECHASVPTDGRSPEDIARDVIAIARTDAIAVPLGTRSYAVEITNGQPEALRRILSRLVPSSLLVVTDENVLAARSGWLAEALPDNVPVNRVVLTPGEEHKTAEAIGKIWDPALTGGIDRQAVVVAFGGGVVGDLAGFAASSLLRGLRCVQVATTLLSMVDSSVGGKTGFDHASGKNLLGAFFQPTHVLLDVDHLTTLPERQRTAGLAEVIKIALACDPELLELISGDDGRIAKGDHDRLKDVVRASVYAKMRVVREDEHETGVRALLNLGHTIGHALETHGGYARWLHGEAVAIGTVLELAAAERLNLAPSGISEYAAALFTRFGLPTTASRSDLRAAWPYVLNDKKRVRTSVKLPVVVAPGQGRIEVVELAALQAALGI